MTRQRINYYELLELDPSVETKAQIEKAIDAKKKKWLTTKMMGIGDQNQADAEAYLKMLDDIKDVMLENPAKRKAEARERRDQLANSQRELRASLVEEIDLHSEGGYILTSIRDEFLGTFSALGEATIDAEIRKQGKTVVDEIPKEDAAFFDPSEFEELVSKLAFISKRDIYDLLDRPASTTNADLLALVNTELDRLRKIPHKVKSDPQLQMKQTVLRKCLPIFRSADLRAQYDNSLKRYPYEKALRETALKVMRSRGHLDADATSKLVARAVKKGLDATEAGRYLDGLERDGIGPAQPDTPAAKPQTCPDCAHENDAGVRACQKCGSKLLEQCPKCRNDKPVADAACWSCAFTSADAARFQSLCSESQDRLDERDFAQARSLLKQMKALIPEAREIGEIDTEIEEQEFAYWIQETRAALATRQFADAETALKNASRVRPQSSDISQLDAEISKARRLASTVQDLQDAIQDGTSEQRILSCWDPLPAEEKSKPGNRSHKARAELAQRRVNACKKLGNLDETLQGDETFVTGFTPLSDASSDQSIRIETCQDPKVVQLQSRYHQANRRLQTVRSLEDAIRAADSGQGSEANIAAAGTSVTAEYSLSHFRRVQLAKELSSGSGDLAAIARWWDELQSTPFVPKHPETVQRCQRISDGRKATHAIQNFVADSSEDEDRMLIQELQGVARGGLEAAARQHLDQAHARIQQIDAVTRAVQDADLGRGTEQQIVDVADQCTFPKNYAYRLAPRVDLARALTHTPPSDHQVGRCWDRLEESLRPQNGQTVQLINDARNRSILLDKIAKNSSVKPLEVHDEQLVELWDPKLLGSCEAAKPYQQEFTQAKSRWSAWKSLQELLQNPDDPRDAERWYRSVQDYDCAQNEQARIERLVETGRKLTPMLRALESGDDDAFSDCFDPDLISRFPAVFNDYLPVIQTIVAEKMSDKIKAEPEGTGWHIHTHNRKKVVVDWTVSPGHLVKDSIVATSPHGFFNTPDEVEHPQEVGGRSGTLSVNAPTEGAELYVTIWPTVKLFESSVVGHPTHIGPIPSSGRGSSGQRKQKGFSIKRMIRRLANG